MRHTKLWFAGRGGNWSLADYEIDALQDGFDDLNQQFGGDTVEKAVGAPLAAVEKAIERKDRAAFASAFDQLTAGCNSCHRSLDHAFIVIRRPTSLPYSDQLFATQK
jgi:cytochrome c556